MENQNPIFLNKKILKRAERSQLIEYYDQSIETENAWLRKQIVDNNRIDLLMSEILDLQVKPFHFSLLRYQFLHPENLQLVFRGSGKCLGRNTRVMCHTGHTKKVQDVKVGDLLMGPDSKPRKVLETHHGFDEMYKVIPIKGKSFVCNSKHILTLKGRGYHKGKIVDFPIKEVIDKGKNQKRGTSDLQWKLFRVPVNYPEQKKELEVDPYFLGLWLGDGSLNLPMIHNPETEIEKWLGQYCDKNDLGLTISKAKGAECKRFYIKDKKRPSFLRTFLKSFDKKFIPNHFLFNSRENRLKLLAGLLDTDGYLQTGCYEIIQKEKKLANQIVRLARSLGLAAYINKKIGKIKERNFEGVYWRISISGDVDMIPCKVERKKASPRKIKKDALVVGFDIEPDGRGEYFGFELDGDGRFLLGDFTVTHNSTSCTISKTIHLLLKNPNLRILIASKTTKNAEGFLREVKTHFEKNEKLIDVFGEYCNFKDHKWESKEIDVLKRTKHTKEANVTCVGVDGTIVSKHYDVIISDDLIDESNSRTEHMRKKTRDFYYNTLEPTLEPPDGEVEHRGEHHRLGTRFHYDDLYGHWLENELKFHHQIIPALNEKGQSPWPEKYPPDWFLEKRRRSGLIIFDAQYQCNTAAMKGKIFQYDLCQEVEEENIPNDLRIFMGVDLAIGEKEENDNFVIVVVGVDTNKNYYILDFYEGKIRFSEQTRKIKKFYKKWDPIKCLVETNAYQEAQFQNLQDSDKTMRVKPKKQHKDKISRAWKRSADFDDKRVFFKKTGKSHISIERIVLFPDGKGSKDFFDAMDLAFVAANSKQKKKRRIEPGLFGGGKI